MTSDRPGATDPARPPIVELRPTDAARFALHDPLPLAGKARIYVCGITPYDVTHLGHAATFVWADAAASVLRLAGVEVETARNVTDVDDVLTDAAGRQGRHFDEFALSQEFLFDHDMDALRVRRPTHAPRARRHVQHVVQLAAALLACGAAYEREGRVYFRGADVPARAGLDREAALALSAAFNDHPDDPLRDDPLDVAVWLPSGPSDPAFPSPWGWGRPGWHAGCSAMALDTLGGRLDILAGGEDLVFPHHAYQVAMVEAVVGAGFARAQMHVGTVSVDGAKMAKSTGNLVLVRPLLDAHRPAALRLLLLDRAWSQPWEYAEQALVDADARLERLYSAAGRGGGDAAARQSAVTALVSNLDVPTALDVAEESGGEVARLVLRTLALD